LFLILKLQQKRDLNKKAIIFFLFNFGRVKF